MSSLKIFKEQETLKYYIETNRNSRMKIINKIKNPVGGFNNRISTDDYRMSEIEGKLEEIVQFREKNMRKIYKNVKDLRTDIPLI